MSRAPEKPQRRRLQGVTIADVAARAGVSIMTVSRVINGEGRVSDETRARIGEIIREMNYTPSPAARGLASAAVTRIGLLYTNPSGAYLSEFLIGVMDEISRTGDHLLLHRCDSPEAIETAVAKLTEEGVDGVVLPPPLCDSDRALDLLAKAGKPVVAVATAREDEGVLAVRLDDYAAARTMAEHLLALGHRKIAFVTGDAAQLAARRRLAGFRDALAAAGLAPHAVAEGDYSYRSGIEAAIGLLDASERPTAIFAANDDMASAVMSIAHRRGLDVPGDLSVVGFDDSLLATTSWPELTTSHQPIGEMARLAIELLLRHVRARRTGGEAGISSVQADYRLVVRESAAAL